MNINILIICIYSIFILTALCFAAFIADIIMAITGRNKKKQTPSNLQSRVGWEKRKKYYETR